jgi:hypothetical protein
MPPKAKKRTSRGKNAAEENLTQSASSMKCGGIFDNKRREMGGSNKMKATKASRDQPRRGMERLGASKIPHRKAREIQKRGMGEVYIN